MTRLERYVNLVAVVLPFLGFLAAIVVLWNSFVTSTDLAILAVMYFLCAIGITIGYHRLSHIGPSTPVAPVRYGLAVLGSMAVQGPVIDWVADHRKHHAFSDDDGDPHSPHGHGAGFSGAVKGLFYAHMGWLAVTQGQAEQRSLRAGPAGGPVVRRITARSHGWSSPAWRSRPRSAAALTGTVHGALTASSGAAWCASSCSTT